MKDLYRDLLKQGWTLPEIDGMDILFFFELAQHKEQKQKTVFIDQIPFL